MKRSAEDHKAIFYKHCLAQVKKQITLEEADYKKMAGLHSVLTYGGYPVSVISSMRDFMLSKNPQIRSAVFFNLMNAMREDLGLVKVNIAYCDNIQFHKKRKIK